MLKQGIHDKDNPLMSPGSNSSNTNTNTNAESPSSITSPIMGSISQNHHPENELEDPESGNGAQMMGSGGLVGQQSWSPHSEEEQRSTSPSSKSPNRNVMSPHNSVQNATPPYGMMSAHPNMTHYGSTMKTELSPPTNENSAMLPSYPMNGTLTSMSMGGEIHQVPSYANPSSLHQPQTASHPSMMPTQFWYNPGTEIDHSGMPQAHHVDHRNLNDSGYLK